MALPASRSHEKDESTEGAVRLPANAYTPLAPGETFEPIVPAAAAPPEVTFRSLGWGVLLCVIFTVASAYSGLKVGQVMEAAIPISILAIGLARVYARRSSLLENVIITGVGGVAGGVAAGAIFTLPALYALKLDPHPAQTIFIGVATPKTDFLTARTGFVVLHPLKGVVGHEVEVEHVDGTVERSTFPERVNPIQPFLLIRSLTHEVLPGLKATVRMEGDAWEMEDHRNWTDASFKTYVRPLALPWPYTLKAGEAVKQSVTLTLTGATAKTAKRGATKGIEVKIIAMMMPSWA